MLSGIPEMPDCVCDMESVESVCDMGPLSLAFLVYALLSVGFIFLPFSGDIFWCLHSTIMYLVFALNNETTTQKSYLCLVAIDK